jgi:hypothetical protein
VKGSPGNLAVFIRAAGVTQYSGEELNVHPETAKQPRL